jgi:hypothetical protein
LEPPATRRQHHCGEYRRRRRHRRMSTVGEVCARRTHAPVQPLRQYRDQPIAAAKPAL